MPSPMPPMPNKDDSAGTYVIFPLRPFAHLLIRAATGGPISKPALTAS